MVSNSYRLEQMYGLRLLAKDVHHLDREARHHDFRNVLPYITIQAYTRPIALKKI